MKKKIILTMKKNNSKKLKNIIEVLKLKLKFKLLSQIQTILRSILILSNSKSSLLLYLLKFYQRVALSFCELTFFH